MPNLRFLDVSNTGNDQPIDVTAVQVTRVSYCLTLLAIARYFRNNHDVDAAWKRVAELVRDRRIGLGMSAEEAVVAGGGRPSVAVWSLIENARQAGYSALTISAICKALRWDRTSIDRILEGLEPIEVDDAAEPRPGAMEASIGPSYVKQSTFEHLAERVGRLEHAVLSLLEQRNEPSGGTVHQFPKQPDPQPEPDELPDAAHKTKGRGPKSKPNPPIGGDD